MSNELLHCPACGELTLHRRLHAKNQRSIWECAGYGLGRAETSNFNPNEYYTNDYFSGGYADGYANYRNSEIILDEGGYRADKACSKVGLAVMFGRAVVNLTIFCMGLMLILT